MTLKKNLPWIDNAKALCMIAVYFIHSQVYYGSGVCGDYLSYFILPFYVNLFFFISGFLFLGKNTYTVGNVVYRLIIPTILFSTMIYVPKLFFHGRDISIAQYFYDVWGGVSFWFTSSLALVQLIFILFAYLGVRNRYILLIAGAILFIIGNILNNYDPEPFPWHFKSAMCASLFFAAGGIYSTCSEKIPNTNRFNILIFITYILLLIITYKYRAYLKFGSMGVDYSLGGTLVCFVSIFAMIGVSKLLGYSKLLEFIGRKSIVFYFFSGVMPALWGTIAKRLLPHSNDLVTVAVTVLALLSAAVITYIINERFQFLIDLRSLFKK